MTTKKSSNDIDLMDSKNTSILDNFNKTNEIIHVINKLNKDISKLINPKKTKIE